ncbi:hypothetical protein [Priestia megaterium]|nr:hypothetical protein [Priestia megaterium]MED3805607.1 hypothetical protein [Priestia megaterium]MED4396321.1 hypothetical protein [Priestia megaterium]MED4737154.1 hypothetical protein [Priestia megaterium]
MARQKGFVKMTVKNDNFDKLIKALEDLDKYSVEVGIFASDDSFYAMIANVHEYGITIKPKKQFLTIPTKEADGRKASDIPGLFKPKGKNILAIQDGDNLKVMFILVKSVTIPERSFVRSTFDEKNDEWVQFMERLIDKVLAFEIDAKTLFERVGAKAAADIQEKITTLRSPGNSPITMENKGSSNPLIDTGGLRARVTWRVVERNA